MPGKVKVKIISGRNLPVMDRSSDTTDAYVEIKLGSTTYKTDVCRKSLHPQWNSEWYRFEVDDSELQDEPLQIRLMDYDTYSANDAIGKVYLDLNPLLLPVAGQKLFWNGDGNTNHEHASNSSMSGWIPVYDTMHGIRGEVNVIVKVELFSDFNRFRQSSCGVQFFCSKSIPHGYFAQTVHGFVEELIVNDDPEYQWIDKIRTPRASNEARQTLFFKLSGELQRKIGLKALDMGANSVIGYCQCFDLEGESGIVARGIGTAVTLVKLIDIPQTNIEPVNEERAKSYLNFLGSAAGFRLNLGHASDSFSPYTRRSLPYTHIPVLDIDDPRYRNLSKRLYQTEFNAQLRSTRSNPSISRRHPSVDTLLKQEDMRGTPGYGIGRKIKNLKYSSHNMLSKKMIALKARLGDTGIEEVTDSDNSAERKRKAFKYKRTLSESSVMAELLARSVIHAHNNLTCIIEAQDSISSQSQCDDDEDERKEREEDFDNANLETNVSNQFLSVEEPQSENVSNVSSSTTESLSSDEESDELKESNVNFETLSNIVKNVEILEQNFNRSEYQKGFSKQMSLPVLPLDEDQDSFFDDSASNNRFIFPEIKEAPNSEEIQDAKSIEIELEDPDSYSLNRSVSVTAPIAKLDSDVEDSLTDQEATQQSSQKTSKTIIPPVMMGCDIKKPQSLVKTAMQTILLDKVNIMGTYSPPLSPTTPNANSVFNVASPISSSTSLNPSNGSGLNTPKQMPRSSTAISLDAYGTGHDTVLGAPFVSMRRQQSHPCISGTARNTVAAVPMCLSDSELHKPQVMDNWFLNKKSQDNIDKNKLTFLHLLSHGNEAEGDVKKLQRVVSHDYIKKRKFSFLHLSRRKSHDLGTNLKKVKSEDLNKSRFGFLHRSQKLKDEIGVSKSQDHHLNIISNIFHHKSLKGVEQKKDDAAFKKHGLVGTALGNVLMETVQDILATSNADKKDKEEVVINPVAPSPDPLTSTNEGTNECPLVPVNTEIDGSSSFSDNNNMHAGLTPSLRTSSPAPDANTTDVGHHRAESVGTKMVQSPAKLNSVPCIYRRSSDSDLSITPKGSSLTGSDRSGVILNGQVFKSNMLLRATAPQENFDMLEYPFLTMSKYPQGFILKFGGAVSARSVKLLERISNLEEPESRDTWWSEIRMEIRSHARALNCNAVLGYCETTSICEDVCVLSACGTAAVIGFQYTGEIGDTVGALTVIPKAHPKDSTVTDCEKDRILQKTQENNHKTLPESPEYEGNTGHTNSCSICHLPYNTNNIPVRSTVLKCASCRTGKVPDVLIATIEAPDGAPTIGRGCFIQSFVCRQLKDLRGESNAKEISDGLPFLEYELHRLLINKLKIKVGIATGTAQFLTPLPTPVLPKLISDRTSDEKKLTDLQKLLNDTVKKNREIYQLKTTDDCQNWRVLSDDDSEEEQTSIDLAVGNKDCCILEVDDPEDAEVVNMLMEERPPDGFHVVNTEFVPGLDELEIVKNLQMFTQIYRAKFQAPYNFDVHFHRLLQSVYFKLRRMVPCALCDLQFTVELPENDEVQLCVLGMALGLGDPPKIKYKTKCTSNKRLGEDDLIFNLEEDQIPENSVTPQIHLSTLSSKLRQKSPSRNRIQTVKQRHMPYKERHGVDITPLSYVPGGKIENYLGNLNFFFIRETTSIREEGGLSGFIHSFATEVLAIVRAHVTALGGNAMVAYFMTECILNHNLHKNQGQCLINVGGDVVFVSYFKEEP